mgnify:CR=1 FL=1
MSTPAKVVIRYKFDPHHFHGARNLKIEKNRRKGGVCLACGAPLKDPVSRRRGYGRECWKHVPVMIVLDIRPEEE